MEDNELGILKDYWYPIFIMSTLIYDRLIIYLQQTYGYDLE
jgi:hypothetical protein